MTIQDTFKINNKIQLLKVNESHAPGLYQIIKNDRKKLIYWLPELKDTKSQNQELSFIKYAQHKMQRQKLFMYTILKDQRVVGELDLHNLDWQNQTGEIGYFLSSKVQGKGIMTKSVAALVKQAFLDLNLHKIMIETDPDNQKSKAIPKRLGFVYEGLLKDQRYINSKYRDAEIYSIFNKNYQM